MKGEENKSIARPYRLQRRYVLRIYEVPVYTQYFEG